MSDNLSKYPYVISYKLPNGNQIMVAVHNDAEAEAAFDTMIELCGPDVQYSID